MAAPYTPTDYQSYTITIYAPCGVMTLLPNPLPDAKLNVSYGQQLTASNGNSPYTYAITSGTLPTGLSLTSGGLLSGTPTVAGTSSFTITVTDAANCTTDMHAKLYVYSQDLLDHQTKLQQIICCMGGAAADLCTDLKNGTACPCDIKNLEILAGMLDTLYCYDPTLTTNCLTQQQVDSMFDYISKYLCDVCYFPKGTNYSQLASRQGIRLTEAGERRITEDNNLRTIN